MHSDDLNFGENAALLCVDLQKCYYRPPITNLFPQLEMNTSKVLSSFRYLIFDVYFLFTIYILIYRGLRIYLWYTWGRRMFGAFPRFFLGGQPCIQDRKTTLGCQIHWTVLRRRKRSPSLSRIHLTASSEHACMSIYSNKSLNQALFIFFYFDNFV